MLSLLHLLDGKHARFFATAHLGISKLGYAECEILYSLDLRELRYFQGHVLQYILIPYFRYTSIPIAISEFSIHNPKIIICFREQFALTVENACLAPPVYHAFCRNKQFISPKSQAFQLATLAYSKSSSARALISSYFEYSAPHASTLRDSCVLISKCGE